MQILDVRNQLAKHPSKQYSKRPLEAIKYLVIHHSATSAGDAFSFARYHVNNRDWPGIGYHYVILENGIIQWTNELTTVSNHVRGYNSQSIGICLVGDFTNGNLKIPQKEALKELCQNLLTRLNLNADIIKGHNELSSGSTVCPALDMDVLREYITNNEIEVFINGNKSNISAFLKDGVTYVPIRPLGETLGYQVTWDGQNNRVYLERDDTLELIKQERDHYISLINKIKNILSGV